LRVCHQKDRKGNAGKWDTILVNLRSTYKKNAVALTIEMGKGMMTGYFHRFKKRNGPLLLQFLYGEEIVQNVD